MAQPGGDGANTPALWPEKEVLQALVPPDEDDESGRCIRVTGYYSPVLSCFTVRRQTRVCGGWLCEAMGLGKTIITLALIVSDHQTSAPPYKPPKLSDGAMARIKRADKTFAKLCKTDKLVASKATLVIAPLSLVAQWKQEAKTRLKETLPTGKELNVVRWYGTSRTRNLERLAKADVVLTTYDTVARSWRMDETIGEYKKYCEEAKAKHARDVAKAAMTGKPVPPEPRLQGAQVATLHQILWRRVVFDESQYVKAPKMARSSACAALTSQRRWLLSGTPVSTSPEDLIGQFSVLGLSRVLVNGQAYETLFRRPFDETHQKMTLGICANEDSNDGYTPVNSGAGAMRWLLPRMMIRHASGQMVGGELVGALPPKTESVIKITMSAQERAVYKKVDDEMRHRFAEVEALGVNVIKENLFFCMSLLTPLRKLCSGGTFIPTRDLVACNQVARKLKGLAVAPQSLLPAVAVADNDPTGSSYAVCSLEPEDGVRTRCCRSWCCYSCLMGVAQEEEAKCPSCSRAIRAADVPRPPSKTGVGFSGESMAPMIDAGGPSNGAANAAGGAIAGGNAEEDAPISMQSKLKVVLTELAKVREEDASVKTLIFSQYSQSLTRVRTSCRSTGTSASPSAATCCLRSALRRWQHSSASRQPSSCCRCALQLWGSI